MGVDTLPLTRNHEYEVASGCTGVVLVNMKLLPERHWFLLLISKVGLIIFFTDKVSLAESIQPKDEVAVKETV